MTRSVQHKTRTNVTLDAEALSEAKALGLNVSAISNEALIAAVRQARARAWADDNAAAIAERRAWIDRNGTPLADHQVLQGD
ncbi:MAG: type II toxin-antitoxin system CcdA family antitoxin [Pseudomonadota bacterium]